MILPESENKCCGCGACANKCPNQCITLVEDEKGFHYPTVDVDKCVDCHLCKTVCPYQNESAKTEPIGCFAAINPDETVRLNSSSGGIFSLISQKIIERGGVVFGALFDEKWQVRHGFVENIEDLDRLRGSKYVQSDLGDSYNIVEQFLDQGREVVFSGTPCQINGLRRFLKKTYDNLLLLEIACHGVPSPKVWREYIGEALKKEPVKEVNFRSKSTGWKDYSVRIGDESRRHDFDDFIGCFLGNYSLRPSCFNCQFKAGKSGADIMIADFWGVNTIAPHLDDDKGTSLIIVYSSKGKTIIDGCGIQLHSFEYPQVVKANPSIEHGAQKPDDYDAFWNMFCGGKPIQAIKKYGKCNRPSKLKRIVRRILK